MKIPREFQRELFMFISSELQSGDRVNTPPELAELCKGFTLRWFGVLDLPSTFKNDELRFFVSFAERLGNHVGKFFLTPKEG
jgi:hypothetical protein